jgi:hypothetical protein
MNRLGYWAAIGACAAAIGYAIPQLAQVAGLLPDPLDRILIFAPSLALAPCFVVALAAACADAEGTARPWRFGALALAILYGAMASIVYVNQLGVVIPRELAGLPPAGGNFACCGFRDPMTAIDLLGYTYMSLATLLLAPTCRGALRLTLVANGLLAPFLILQLAWPVLIWVGALWLVLFPAAMALLARDFRISCRTGS